MEEKKKIVEAIGSLVESDSAFDKIAPEIRRLKSEFVALTNTLREENEKSFREKEGPEAEYTNPHDEWDTTFSEYMSKFNKLRKKWEEQKADELGRNLEIKKKIIADLEKVIIEEQHIGHAFEKFNELKEKWKKTGNVPSSDYRDIQQQYSQQLDRFFYNINIYKTLKEYDLKKNLQLKTELITKVKDLQKAKNIREMRELISAYVKEWEEIGPTRQDEWEKVRDEFWEACREVYRIIGDHFKEQKEKQKTNLESKEKLCDRVEELLNQSDLSDKQWNAAIKEVQEIQTEWKKIGFAGKKKNDTVWKRFRVALDGFYNQRNEHRTEMKDVYKENEDKKIKLITRAEELKDSVDWKNTAEIYKKLQADWKRIGTTHPAREQKLWKRFRAASDHFFNSRKAFFDGREDREKENLKKKEELMAKLKSFKPEGEKGRAELVEMGKEWNAIGFVPADQKQKVEAAYNKLFGEKLQSLGMKSHEVDEKLFDMKVEGLKDADHGDQVLRNEFRQLDDKLRKIEAHIQQYENNLGFFGDASADNPLVKQVMQKIEDSKEEASRIRSRIEKLRN